MVIIAQLFLYRKPDLRPKEIFLVVVKHNHCVIVKLKTLLKDISRLNVYRLKTHQKLVGHISYCYTLHISAFDSTAKAPVLYHSMRGKVASQ